MTDIALISLIVGAALVSAFNPGSLSVLILVLSSIFGRGHSSRKILVYGSSFIAGLLIFNLAIGTLAYGLVAALSPSTAGYVSLALGLCLSILGLVEVKDYFWYGKGFSLRLPKSSEKTLHYYAIKIKNIPSFIVFGIYCGAILLPFYGGAYFAVTTVLGISFHVEAIRYIAFYSILLSLPLFIIMLLVATGTKLSVLTKWKEEAKGAMRLTSGVLITILGWILILVAAGAVNFG